MTTTFGATLEVKTQWTYSESDDFGERAASKASKKYTLTIGDGTGANEAQWVYRSNRIVTPSTTTDDIDLAAVLQDVLNLTINAATIRAVIVANLASASGDTLLVGGAGAGGNAWGAPFNGDQDAQAVVGPGFPFTFGDTVDGLTVTPTSGDVLRIEHGGGSNDVPYDLILIGTSG